MGDRGNIVLTGKETFGTARVYLYTHWGGSERKEILARALDRGRSRWGDGSYLSRVIFDELIGGNKDVTGYGLSCIPTDNEYPFLVVDVDKNTVFELADVRDGFDIALKDDNIVTPMPFENFIEKFKPTTKES